MTEVWALFCFGRPVSELRQLWVDPLAAGTSRDGNSFYNLVKNGGLGAKRKLQHHSVF